MKGFDVEIGNYKGSMKLELDQEVDKLIKNKLQQYDAVASSFSEFFNASALRQAFDGKADLQLISLL
jgi:hypothetical protein